MQCGNPFSFAPLLHCAVNVTGKLRYLSCLKTWCPAGGPYLRYYCVSEICLTQQPDLRASAFLGQEPVQYGVVVTSGKVPDVEALCLIVGHTVSPDVAG